MSQLSDATLMALTAHEGQYRRDSKPYVIHPLAVAFALIARVGERAAVVGLLHDVIEDRPKEATIIDNVLLFRHLSVTLDAEQCAALQAQTQMRGENYDDAITRVITSGRMAIEVKLADIAHNLSALTPDMSDGRAKYLPAAARLNNALAILDESKE